MRSKTVLVIVLIVVVAVAGSVACLKYAGIPSPFESAQEREMREDSGFRQRSVHVGLTFLWTPDISAEMLGNSELKRMLFKVNNVFHDLDGVYVWLYRNEVWNTPVEDVYHTGEGFDAGCSRDVWSVVYKLYPIDDLPIVIIPSIQEDTFGVTCVSTWEETCPPGDVCVPGSAYRSTLYVVLSLDAIRSSEGYRVLIHELIHAFAPDWLESQVYGIFPVDKPSVTALASDYSRGFPEVRIGAHAFNVRLPDDYDAFN